MARAEESAHANAAEIDKAGDNQNESSADVFKVSRKPGKYSGRSAFSEPKTNNDDIPNPPKPGRKCFDCGGPFPYAKDRPCPAKEKSCKKRSRLNHFASQCRGAKNVLAAAAQDFSASLGKVKHVDSVVAEPYFVTIDSDRGAIKFNPDTGADVTAIDALTFNALGSRPQLSTGIKLMPYGATTPLVMSGNCSLRLSYGDKEIDVYVSQTSNRGVSLLSRSASRALDLVTLNYTRSICIS